MAGRHYLDHASTAPARPEVVEAMLSWLAGTSSADPGRVHTEGRMARVAIEEAREQVAGLFGARPREVVFMSGATEAINAATFGAAAAAIEGGRRAARIVCPAVEHSSVLESANRYARVVLGVDRYGRVDLDAMKAALDSESESDFGTVALVNVQWGNHEVGTLQPVSAVVELARARGALVHIDAAQAAGRVPIAFDELGADLMSITAHKIGGPKGVGALLVRRGLRLDPFVLGGDQERARRGGIENVPAIMGFGAVCDLLTGGALDAEGDRARAQTDRVLALAGALDSVETYGHPVARLPHVVCLGVSGVESEAVLLGLDQAGIAAHSGSSCSSEALEPSPVLAAMGVDAQRSLRISVGWSTTDDDITALERALPDVITRLRALGI
jgi:cysteine desulfurase